MHNTCRRQPNTLSVILCKSAAQSPFYFNGQHNNPQRQHKFKRISTPKQRSQTHTNGLPHTWGGHSPQPNPQPACEHKASAPSRPLGKRRANQHPNDDSSYQGSHQHSPPHRHTPPLPQTAQHDNRTIIYRYQSSAIQGGSASAHDMHTPFEFYGIDSCV